MAPTSPSALLVALFPAAVIAQTALYLPPGVTDGDEVHMGGYTMAQIKAWTNKFPVPGIWAGTSAGWANDVDGRNGAKQAMNKDPTSLFAGERVHNIKLISGGPGLVVTGIYAVLKESGIISPMEKLTLQFGKPSTAGKVEIDVNVQTLITQSWYPKFDKAAVTREGLPPPSPSPPSPPSRPMSETYYGSVDPDKNLYMPNSDRSMGPNCYHVGVDPDDATKALLLMAIGPGWAQKRMAAASFKIGDGTSAVPPAPTGFKDVRRAFSIAFPGVTIEPEGLDLKGILPAQGYVSMCSPSYIEGNGLGILSGVYKGARSNKEAGATSGRYGRIPTPTNMSAPFHTDVGVPQYDLKIFPQYQGPQASSPLEGAGSMDTTTTIGISVGGAIALVLLILLVLCLIKRSKRDKSAEDVAYKSSTANAHEHAPTAKADDNTPEAADAA